MTFTAGWRVLDPGNAHSDSGTVMTVETPEDVDALVAALSDPNAMQAGVQYPEAAHSLTIGVHDGYGYLAYAGEDGYLMSAGDPATPEWGENADFDPGSGIPIEQLAAALKEYLQTGQRPTNIEWRDAV